MSSDQLPSSWRFSIGLQHSEYNERLLVEHGIMGELVVMVS